MAGRDILLKIHRWIGLSVGLVFCIASLTGAALVFEPELERVLNIGALEVTDGDVGVVAVEAAALEQVADARATSITWPTVAVPAYRVQLTGADGVRNVWIDPGSGRVTQRAWRSPVLEGVRRLHASLLAGRPGRLVVWTASMLAVIGLLTGLYLWWPGLRRFAAAFRVRLRRDAYVVSYDTHQVAGAAMLPLLLLMTCTGIVIEQPAQSRRIAHGLFGSRAPEQPLWPAPRLGAPVARAKARPILELYATARAAVRDADPVSAQIPRDSLAPVRVTFAIGPASMRRETVLVAMDPASGRILEVQDPRALSAPERLHRTGWMSLHTAAWGGPVVRVLYAVACLVGGFLVPTGVIVWWLKRTRTQEARARMVARSVQATSDP